MCVYRVNRCLYSIRINPIMFLPCKLSSTPQNVSPVIKTMSLDLISFTYRLYLLSPSNTVLLPYSDTLFAIV